MPEMPKSGKRETGVALLSFSGALTAIYFGCGLMGWAETEVIKALSTPFYVVIFGSLGWSAGAFGMHSLATQFGQKN